MAHPDNTPQTERRLLLGAFPKEKHSTSPVSHGRPPLTVTPAPWTPSPLCPLIPHGCPPLTDPDTPWTPSPHCPLIPSGRPPLSVPRHPVDALPSMSPDALWTPSPHCSLMPCGCPPLTVPENSLQLWHQSGGTEAALLPSRGEDLFLTGPTVLPLASLSSGSWCSHCSPRCADARAALQCACSSICAVWLSGGLYSSLSSLCLQEMILAGREIVGLARYSHV